MILYTVREVAAILKVLSVTVQRLCAVRYVGQGTELEVALPSGPLGPAVAEPLRQTFERSYREHYNTVNADVAVEVLTWRVSVAGPAESLEVRFESSAEVRKRKGERPVYFGPAVGLLATGVYDRYALVPGDRLAGPAVIEERESTTVVDPGADITVDGHGNLIIDLR